MAVKLTAAELGLKLAINKIEEARKLEREQLAKHYLELDAEIPGGLPDGTGIFTPIAWVRWAKKQLGY